MSTVGETMRLQMRCQGVLDFTPAPAPVPPVVDQRVAHRQKQLGAMARKVLEMLQEGPQTNRSLARAFPDGAAWRSRLSDVRAFLRGGNRDIEPIPRHDCGDGLVWYWLEA